MIFDTHIHLNDDKYEDVDTLINNARNKGVTKFLCIGFDVESSKKAIVLAEKYDCVYASVGIIPTEHKQYNKTTLNELEKLINKSKKVICVGEIGLDYYWEKDDEVKKVQKEMFIKQIKLANKYNLPISIHARDALSDTLEILKECKVLNKGIMHCYSGSLEMAKEFIKLGFKIAFGGVLTFKNSIKTKEVLLGINVEDVVFETDGPYLSPTPYRGKINLPEYIVETVKYAANLLNIEQNKLEEITFNNSCKILHVENYENKIK